jgi:hypothetical protein
MNWHILLLYKIVILVQLSDLSSTESYGADADKEMKQPAIRGIEKFLQSYLCYNYDFFKYS